MPQHELKCSECGTVIGTIEESSALERIARAAYAVYTPSPTTSKFDFKHRPWPQLSKSHQTRWKGYVQAVIVALESEGLNVRKKLTELQAAQPSDAISGSGVSDDAARNDEFEAGVDSGEGRGEHE